VAKYDLTKPKVKALTVNRLPERLVVGIKTLAIQLDCTVEDLMTVILERALADGQKLFVPVQRLKKARKQEIEDRRKLRASMEQLQPKLKQLETQNG
jgi:hypothetical protein